ncbi:MAG TPA: ABC transporter permease subunit [Bacillota bacterium]|nr:ABC transporter permease subunit [Bacillota bacterium]
MQSTTTARKERNPFLQKIIDQKQLLLITLPFLLFIIIFNYLPLWGWIMAFQDYKPYLGISGSAWTGLEQFKLLFSDSEFFFGLRNTLAISSLKLVLNTFTAITLALLLNEVRNVFFKRTVQTISYLPHFVSWVVAANIVYTALSPDGGIVNEVLMRLHLVREPILFMAENSYFWGIAALSEVWQEVGWNAIIYLAAITTIDPELYESASIDGAGRLKRIFAITIPGIMSTIKILLVLNIGFLLNAGMQQVYLLQNSANIEVSQILEIYILNYGLKMGRYSYATAAGIFNSVVSVALVFAANRVSRRIDGERLF